jgi:hypothetical protein
MATCSQPLHVAVSAITMTCTALCTVHVQLCALYMHSHNLKLINATKISRKEKLTLHGVTVLKITTHGDKTQKRAFFL